MDASSDFLSRSIYMTLLSSKMATKQCAFAGALTEKAVSQLGSNKCIVCLEM